jgi:hypothetical protein
MRALEVRAQPHSHIWTGSVCPRRWAASVLCFRIADFSSRRYQNFNTMAEIIAGVGVASSVVQLIDFGSKAIKVLKRLKEFGDQCKDVPESFRAIQSQLPLLAAAIDLLKTSIEGKLIADPLNNVISSVLKGCEDQLSKLDDILSRTLPKNNSWMEKGKKAVTSVKLEHEFKKVSDNIRGYISTLGFYQSIVTFRLQELATMGRVFLRPGGW